MKYAFAGLFLLLLTSPALAEVREFKSYFGAMLEYVALPVDAKPRVFYTYDQNKLDVKLAEYNLKFPENVTIADKGLYLLILLDKVGDPVTDISWDTAKGQVLIDTAPDKKAEIPKPVKGKSNFLLEVFVVTPQAGIKSFAIVSKRVRQEVPGEELKGDQPAKAGDAAKAPSTQKDAQPSK